MVHGRGPYKEAQTSLAANDDRSLGSTTAPERTALFHDVMQASEASSDRANSDAVLLVPNDTFQWPPISLSRTCAMKIEKYGPLNETVASEPVTVTLLTGPSGGTGFPTPYSVSAE
jgi:hypothetical protein